MDLDSCLKDYPKVMFSDFGDEVFITFRLLMNGMCSHRLAKFLNYASGFLKEDEFYLEIGTYTGYTLLSAGYERMGRFIGIDNFSENYSIKGKVEDRLRKNMERWQGAYTVIASDFRDVKLDGMTQGHKAGVFLIDGKHTYQDVMDSISWGKNYLSDQALVIFDDLNIPGVKKAVEEIKQDKRFNEIFLADSFSNGDNGMSTDKYIHNGFSIMTYRKAA